ncbi:MAG: hypothetical protein RR831_11015 [Stenotrophomonas sp.]
MKRPVSTPLVFAGVVLALAGVATAGGALQTVDATLRATISTTPTDATQQPPWEQPLRTTAIATPRAASEPMQVPSRTRPNLLLDAERLQAARQALETLPGLAGERLVVFHDIHFHEDGRIDINLVDPQQPGHVDAYHYQRGQWRKGDAVNPQQFAPTITLRRSSTALANIDFDAVPRVAQALQEQRNALMRTPADVGHVYVVIRKGGKLVWLPDEVAGDRQTVRLRYDARGNLQ